jgi:hypothetical protein
MKLQKKIKYLHKKKINPEVNKKKIQMLTRRTFFPNFIPHSSKSTKRKAEKNFEKERVRERNKFSQFR